MTNSPDPSRKARIALGTAFTSAGIAHIVKNEWFEQMDPAARPNGIHPAAAHGVR
jgi:hypothetical protein